MQLKNAIPGLLLALSMLGGCAGGRNANIPPSPPPSTRPVATDIDPASANPDYWYAQPAIVNVSAGDFDKLWQACERALRARRFTPDRMDYRDGVMTSQPLTSRQFWEVWRSDVVDSHGLTESSIGTLRRTIRFDLSRSPDGACAAIPRVVIERFTAPEQRITVALNYRAALSSMERTASRSPQSISQPGTRQWYALHRDTELEKALAQDVQENLAR